MAQTDLTAEEIREVVLEEERKWYTSEDGFLDFVRDSGAAPDAEWQPHGKYANQIIGWHGEPDPDNPEQINYRWKLTLWPRGSFKSQVFTIGQASWLIARDPNIRILVCSETDRQAKKFTQEVMKIVSSPWFVERFGDRKGSGWKIGSGSFMDARRSRKGVKDPTLQPTGVGAVQVGSHWDFIIMDDICSQENTKTDDSIVKLWDWFCETIAQLDPGCKLSIIGTLHHYSDVYCKIMKNPDIKKKFDISCHGWAEPLIDPRDNEADATLFFPSRLTRTFVSERKEIYTPRLFACFYENRPTTGEQQIFRPEYFRSIPDISVPQNIWTYIFTDFAFIAEDKKTQRADRTVFWVVALDANRVAYVLDVYVGRWKPSDSVRLLCRLWDQYRWANVKAAVIEKTSHKELISSLLEEIRRETMTRPRLIEIEGRNQEIKDMRIESAEPRWRRGDIYFIQSVRDEESKFNTVFSEMIQWPFSDHDDIPDAVSDIDKVDKNGKLYCPGPPIHWNQQAIRRNRLPVVDGRFNPSDTYTAHERIEQRGNNRHDIWKSSDHRMTGRSLQQGSHRSIWNQQDNRR